MLIFVETSGKARRQAPHAQNHAIDLVFAACARCGQHISTDSRHFYLLSVISVVVYVTRTLHAMSNRMIDPP